MTGVSSARHGEDAGTCATKLLWTRVQLGVIRSLQKTTLAELIEFDSRPGVGVTRPRDHS